MKTTSLNDAGPIVLKIEGKAKWVYKIGYKIPVRPSVLPKKGS